jgi:hypothetical protein
MQPPIDFIMNAEFLRSIPALSRKKEIELFTRTIRGEVYANASAGNTKYNWPVPSYYKNGVTQVNGRFVPTPDELMAELIRTLEGCKVTHVTAEKGEYGYNRPESIEIDWS